MKINVHKNQYGKITYSFPLSTEFRTYKNPIKSKTVYQKKLNKRPSELKKTIYSYCTNIRQGSTCSYRTNT